MLYLLDVLGNGFECEDPEKMILDVAPDLRETNGSDTSRIVLEVGAELIPTSSKIKSDLICDLWAMVSDSEEESSLLEEIVDLVQKTTLNEVNSYAKELICYYGLCAMVFLDREDEIDSYLSEYVFPNISMGKLKTKIRDLLENPKSFRPSELRVT